MSVKDYNSRIIVTLPKDQIKWLREFCKKRDITPSLYIKWLLSRKADEMLRVIENEKTPVKEELEEMIRISKISWLK